MISAERAAQQGKKNMADGIHQAAIRTRDAWVLKLAEHDSNIDKALGGFQQETG